MKRTLFNFTSAIILMAILLSACAQAPAPTPEKVVETVQVNVPVEVTKIVAGAPQVVITEVTKLITATPEPQKPQAAAGSIAVNGAGATFPLPVYTQWIFAYQYVDPSVTLNYQGIGSGGGKKGIIDNTIDFAGSDSALNDTEYKNGKDLQMYPILAGAVVPIYNIQGVTTTVILDRVTLVDIYSGTITKWNDPAIVAINPDLANKLPAKQITAVHRSDGSGTTEIFTNALAAFNEGWKRSVGAGSSVQWPVDKKGNGIGGKGNQGVAAVVQNTPNSIGYVELSYALSNNMPFTRLINKAGKTVKADAASLASAINDYSDKFSDKLTAKIVDGPSEASWPIAGYTYLILHTTNMQDCAKADKILSFWKWALTDAGAAKGAATLGYSALPEAVQQNVLKKMGEVTCSGQPVLK